MDNDNNESNETYENDKISYEVYEHIYNLDDKVQDDLELIALVEGNPRLYDKRRNDYKNVKDRDMAWESIGNALKKPMNGSDTKHRWETLRNLYGRARRQLVNIDKENCLSGSSQTNIVIEDMLTPQSKAIHRFLGKLYVPRKTTSNYKRSRMLMPLTSVSNTESSVTSYGFSAIPSPSFVSSAASVSTVTNAKMKCNKLITQSASAESMKQKTQISKVISANSLQETPVLLSKSTELSLCNQNFDNIINESTSTSETDDLSDTKAKRPFVVPKADIRKRKKMYDDTEIALLESSKAINTMCSELPKLLRSTTVKVTQDDKEKDKAMVTVLLQSIKRVPENKKNRCMMKIFEVLQSFKEDYA